MRRLARAPIAFIKNSFCVYDVQLGRRACVALHKAQRYEKSLDMTVLKDGLKDSLKAGFKVGLTLSKVLSPA